MSGDIVSSSPDCLHICDASLHVPPNVVITSLVQTLNLELNCQAQVQVQVK